MSVLIISFSARKDGNCDGISALIAEYYGQDSTIYRFSRNQIHPCGNCQHECFSKERCPYLDDPEYTLLESICHSDLVYFVIPNYCDYPCANYFIFNERSQCFFQGKPDLLERFLQIRKKFIVISNTNQSNFHQILSQNVETEPEILFLEAKKFGEVSIHGNLIASDRAVAEIIQFLKG